MRGIDHPYAAYDELPPKIATEEAGDTWARVLVRISELLESIRLVREGLVALPEGPICAEIKEAIPPGRVGVSVVEAPRGEAVHFVLTGGDNRPYRWRVRAPSYPNLQALPAMVLDGKHRGRTDYAGESGPLFLLYGAPGDSGSKDP